MQQGLADNLKWNRTREGIDIMKKYLFGIMFCFPLLILIVFSFKGIVDLSVVDDHHFDLITVNSIFGGFLFSGLSAILGLGASKTIRTLAKIDSLNKVYRYITSGIMCSIFSICFSLTGILFIVKDITVGKYTISNYFISDTIRLFEIYFLIMTIVLFISSAKYLLIIVRQSSKEIQKEVGYKEKYESDSVINKLK